MDGADRGGHNDPHCRLGRMVPNAQLVRLVPSRVLPFVSARWANQQHALNDAPVNIIQDGMVIDYQAGAVLDTFDVESVEVLRGPQGVLFGRNASGGAIVLRSRRPTGEFGGKLSVSIGDANSRDVNGSIEGSLIEDRLAALELG